MESYAMTFDGALPQRGFWLYIWRVIDGERSVLYVGRTGDISSPHASSPFKRIGHHLDAGPNAKGNARHSLWMAAETLVSAGPQVVCKSAFEGSHLVPERPVPPHVLLLGVPSTTREVGIDRGSRRMRHEQHPRWAVEHLLRSRMGLRASTGGGGKSG
ncbi:MAG TPA: hypothetical protein VK698_14835 [Kofleriaceae bacterium]|nr:hypothetical protein [Kofleriaceae bacterium]